MDALGGCDRGVYCCGGSVADMSATAFLRPIMVTEYIQQICNMRDLNRGLTDAERLKVRCISRVLLKHPFSCNFQSLFASLYSYEVAEHLIWGQNKGWYYLMSLQKPNFGGRWFAELQVVWPSWQMFETKTQCTVYYSIESEK
jgi:hypothetical protein